MKACLPFFCVVLSSPAFAQETRQLDAHEHGVGALNIAFDGQSVAMEFHAPGADIVGFEYAAKSEEDRAAIDAAVAILARPLDVFVLPAAAECTVTQASAELESEDGHDHGEDEHADHEEHDDHADEHAEHDEHDDHADEHAEHDEHADHDDHAHEDGEGAGHTEFHAEYALTCANPGAITEISFAYFDTFPNARALEVQIVSASGAQAFDVEREAPTLDLSGIF